MRDRMKTVVSTIQYEEIKNHMKKNLKYLYRWLNMYIGG